MERSIRTDKALNCHFIWALSALLCNFQMHFQRFCLCSWDRTAYLIPLGDCICRSIQQHSVLCRFSMAEVFLQTSDSSSYITSRRESFTLWMKSLVFHGKGCTVFDSNGKLVYRIDNYGEKSSREVDLMDLRGKVLFSLRQKKLPVFGYWDGYKANDAKVEQKMPCFQVRKNCNVLRRSIDYVVSLGCEGAQTSCYRIRGSSRKSAFKITDRDGILVAEVEPKRSSSGVIFGEDVLSLVVEPHVDHSLVMALVTVYELINHKL